MSEETKEEKKELTQKDIEQKYQVLATQLGDLESKLFFINKKKDSILKTIEKLDEMLKDVVAKEMAAKKEEAKS